MRRVQQLAAHIAANGDGDSAARGVSASATDAKVTVDMEETDILKSMGGIDALFTVLEKQLPKAGDYDIAQHVASPLTDAAKYPNGWVDAFKEFRAASEAGEPHVQHQRWQEAYGDDGLSSNLVVPYLIFKRSDGDVGKRLPPVITHEVIISNPSDAMRIARMHVKKQPNFNLFFYDSVISTIDNKHWREQREQLMPAFLPRASLGQIFPVSAARAALCADRLRSLSANGAQTVDMNDFLLYETQAQLQLALIGEDNDFMEATNERFRNSIGGSEEPGFVRPFCRELVERMGRPINTGAAVPEDVAAGRCPVPHGPVSAAMTGMANATAATLEGNALLLAFAGHDTTGNTLAWMFFSLALAASSPDAHQRTILPRLQAEVAAFFVAVGDRQPAYDDLQNLPYMSRCITETLRLFPAVANGTFRELQFDDTITGLGGKQVPIKKGTYVRISNWSRHRNPDLWGPSAAEWNPDRDFVDAELWHGEALRAYNPSTERFSPFTFTPRDCIGKNFAQLEMRLIAAHLIQNFTFELLPEFLERYDPATYLGINYGTMGPQDLTQDEYVEGFAGWALKRKRPTGLPMKVVPR